LRVLQRDLGVGRSERLDRRLAGRDLRLHASDTARRMRQDGRAQFDMHRMRRIRYVRSKPSRDARPPSSHGI
jgi:hypothetical protein